MPKTAGITMASVDAAIKLIEAAKRMGIQSFALNGFQVVFADMATVASTKTVYDNPFDDPDAWAHVAPRS